MPVSNNIRELIARVLNELKKSSNYEYHVSVDELLTYLNADTMYPDLSVEEILRN